VSSPSEARDRPVAQGLDTATHCNNETDLLLKGSIARIDDAGAEALEGWDMCEIPQQDPPCKAHRNLAIKESKTLSNLANR